MRIDIGIACVLSIRGEGCNINVAGGLRYCNGDGGRQYVPTNELGDEVDVLT